MTGDHDRITSLEVRMSSAEAEIVRTRDRLHDLESDRASVRALAKTVESLVEKIPEVAKRTAEETVVAWWKERVTAQRETWRFRFAWISAGGVVVGVLGYVADHLL